MNNDKISVTLPLSDYESMKEENKSLKEELAKSKELNSGVSKSIYTLLKTANLPDSAIQDIIKGNATVKINHNEIFNSWQIFIDIGNKIY